MNVIEMRHISKRFGDHVVFKDFSMEIKQNEFVVITGSSGAGKSTLLNMMGLLDTPDSGELRLFDKTSVRPFSKKAQRLLKYRIGYVFQNFALIENKTVLYNMKLAIEHFKGRSRKRMRQIDRALQAVGVQDLKNKKVFESSGGQQQRIALARLLLKPCDLILADEPTGSLDAENRNIVFSLLKKLHEDNKTIIVVSHDEEIEKIASRIIRI